VHKVSIIPRGVGALGYTMQRPTEDRFLLGRHDLANRIAVLMGGRASEALVFDGEVSTGAADDLQRATEIALQMVTRFGMDETVGQRTYSAPPQPFLGTSASGVEASKATEREIDVAVRDIITKAFEQAIAILRTRRADLDEGGRLLIARETLTADQFLRSGPQRSSLKQRLPDPPPEPPNTSSRMGECRSDRQRFSSRCAKTWAAGCAQGTTELTLGGASLKSPQPADPVDHITG
jgi:hypothetical protein